MDIVKLPIERRQKTGTAENRRLRRAGRMPGVLYGLGRDSVPFALDERHFLKQFHHGQRTFDLHLDGETQICLLKDVQFNAVGDQIVHVDFLRVDETKTVEVNIALDFVGSPAPVSGAVVEHVRQDVLVTCLPTAIPPRIQVPIGHMEAGDQLSAGQIQLPEGVTLAEDPNFTIVTYHIKHVAVETPAAEEEKSVEPEVIGAKPKLPESEED
jgi:large subunit ribosomal protein L25